MQVQHRFTNIPAHKTSRNRYVRYSNFFFFAKTTIEPTLYEIEQSLKTTAKLEREIQQLKSQKINTQHG